MFSLHVITFTRIVLTIENVAHQEACGYDLRSKKLPYNHNHKRAWAFLCFTKWVQAKWVRKVGTLNSQPQNRNTVYEYQPSVNVKKTYVQETMQKQTLFAIHM